MAEQKPRVLILGGCGFIGRHLVQYLASNELVSHIRVADKQLPATCYLSPAQTQIFENKELVKFVQADLSRDAHAQKAFADGHYDFVFNLCGETRFGLSEEEYKKKCVDSAVACGKVAQTHNITKWIEVSSGQIYQAAKKPSAEDGKIEPWTIQAKYRYNAECALREMNLPIVVLRPAYVYGPGDLTGLTPRISCAAVYKHLNKKMEFLWTDELRINVVHVEDCVRAMWISTTLPSGSIYNLADSADLTQGKLNQFLSSIFHIQTGFHGSIKSNLALLNLAGVAEMANDEHVPTWTQLCHDHKIANTPISPYIDKELLRNNSLCLDGTKITRDSAFVYQHTVSEQEIRNQVNDFLERGLFPRIL